LLFWCKNKTGKFLIIFLAISPVAMGILLRLWFGQSVMLLILAYVFMLLPINYYLFASWWQAKPKNFLETLQTLGANKIQIIKESLCYLSPALKKIMALNIVFILGDLALASLLLPYGKNTAMSLSYNLLGSYRFTLASAGLSLTLLTILLLIAIIYFYDIKDRKFKRGN
jgi:ABC-type Fe3+ transport system permease subunit